MYRRIVQSNRKPSAITISLMVACRVHTTDTAGGLYNFCSDEAVFFFFLLVYAEPAQHEKIPHSPHEMTFFHGWAQFHRNCLSNTMGNVTSRQFLTNNDVAFRVSQSHTHTQTMSRPLHPAVAVVAKLTCDSNVFFSRNQTTATTTKKLYCDWTAYGSDKNTLGFRDSSKSKHLLHRIALFSVGFRLSIEILSKLLRHANSKNKQNFSSKHYNLFLQFTAFVYTFFFAIYVISLSQRLKCPEKLSKYRPQSNTNVA